MLHGLCLRAVMLMLAAAGVAGGGCALTALLRRLLSAYRSVLFLALTGTEFALACGQLRGFSLAALHCAELR